MKLGADIAAIVTGGASGLGLATATALRKAGVKMALFDKNAEIGPGVADGIGATFCDVDVMDQASVEAGFVTARAANGQERILVNCAGGGFGAHKTVARSKEDGAILPYPLDKYIKTIELNLIGSFRCIVGSAAGMMTLEPTGDGDRGAIVNTASVAGEEGQMGQVAYASAKAGLIGMTLPVARDLSAEGIRVNTILPGIFRHAFARARQAAGEGGAFRDGAVPETAGTSGGICAAGAGDDHQLLFQRRGCAARRRDPDAAAVMVRIDA